MEKNLKRAGIANRIIHFEDGDETLEFLFGDDNGPHREPDSSYLLLLDIRMPKVDGIEVLKRIKENEATRKIPTIMITTTDDPLEIEKCYDLGCNSYIVKPVLYDNFVDAVRQLGLYLMIIEVP
jgi:CheY-like chemotaxis protein